MGRGRKIVFAHLRRINLSEDKYESMKYISISFECVFGKIRCSHEKGGERSVNDN